MISRLLKSNSARTPIASFILAITAFPAPADELLPNNDENLVPGDRIFLRVYSEENLHLPLFGVYQVTENGIINLPVAGPIPVTGCTWWDVGNAVEGVLETDLKKGFFVIASEAPPTPATSHSPNQIKVAGSVQHEGPVILPDEGGIDVTLAIAMAGGFKEGAAPRHVKVQRKNSDQPAEAFIVNLDEIPNAKIPPNHFKVLPGDSLFVPAETAPNLDDELLPGDRLFLRMDSDATSPYFGIFQVTDQLIIDIPQAHFSLLPVKSEPCPGPVPVTGCTWKNVADAVEKVWETKLGNRVGKKYSSQVVATKAPPRPPFAAIESPNWIGVGGQVQHQGKVLLPDENGIDITLAIALAGGLGDWPNPSRIRVQRKNADGSTETFNVNLRKVPITKAPLDFFKIFPGDFIFVPENML